MRNAAGLVAAILCASACNTVHDLDDTVLVTDSPRRIELDNSASPTDLVDLILPLRLDKNAINYEDITDPTTQLRFVDVASSVDLPHEIERWDPMGESLVWLRVPLVPARSTDTAIDMFYGAGTNGAEDPATLWADHQLVVHGTENLDSAVGDYTTMTTGSVMMAGGMLADAVSFTARAQGVEYVGSGAALDGSPTFTLEHWIRPDDDPFGGQGAGTILDKGGSLTLSRLEQQDSTRWISPEYRFYQTDLRFADSCDPQSPTAYLNAQLALGVWSHIMYSYDGQTLSLYKNGELDSTFTCDVATPLAASAMPVSLGNGFGTMLGMLDEVRISTRHRSNDYVRAQYLATIGRYVRFAESRLER